MSWQVTGIVCDAENRVSLQKLDYVPPRSGQVIVRTHYTAVSPGTELRCQAGRQQGGQFPFVGGYACSGEVVAAGDGAAELIGQRVFCAGSSSTAPFHRLWGGHVSHALVEMDRLVVVPKAVDMTEVALAKMAAIALRGVRLTHSRVGERVTVVGLGLIGQLSARLFKAAGCQVLGCDLSPWRVELARAAGIDAQCAPGAEMVQVVRKIFPNGADIVVDATGVPSVLGACARLARATAWDDQGPPARLVVQGSYEGDVTLNYWDCFMRQLSILFPRDQTHDDLLAVIGLMEAGQLRMRDLLTSIHRPDEAQAVYDTLRDPEARMVTAAFRWDH